MTTPDAQTDHAAAALREAIASLISTDSPPIKQRKLRVAALAIANLALDLPITEPQPQTCPLAPNHTCPLQDLHPNLQTAIHLYSLRHP